MPAERQRGPSPLGVLLGLLLVAGVTIALLEQASQALLAKQGAGPIPAGYRPVAGLLHAYLAGRAAVLEHWFAAIVVAPFALLAIAFLFLGLKKLSAAMNRWRDRIAGLDFKKASYDLPPRAYSLGELVRANPAPEASPSAGRYPPSRNRAWKCGLSLRSDELRCTTTTAPLLPLPLASAPASRRR